MELQFKISKLANKFFFISNLSEWHFSCRKDYDKAWLEKTGPLIEKEAQMLFEFKRILSKYNFLLGKIFYTCSEKKAWNKLKRKLNVSEFEKMLKIFELMDSRFMEIWKIKELKKRTALIKKSFEYKNYKRLLEKTGSFFKNKKSNKKFTVIAILSPLSGSGITAAGGANIDDYHITLELPKLELNSWELEYSIGILVHEIGHIFFRKSNYTKIILDIIKKLKLPKLVNENIQPRFSNLELISELIIESLAPFGYLAQKYFKFKPTEISFSKSNLKTLEENLERFRLGQATSGTRIKKIIVWQLYPFVASYVEKNKSIDNKFILEIGKKVLIFNK